MPRLVRVAPAAPVPPVVPVAHRAHHRIARPAGTEFIEINNRLLFYYYDMNKQKRRMLIKKIIVFISVACFAIAVLAFAAETAKTELRPAQKIMQARVALLTAINKDLGVGNFKAVVKNTDELAAETKKNREKLPNPFAKDITLAISMLAKDASGRGYQR
jgi:hypothetical protein